MDTYEVYKQDQCPIGKDLYKEYPDYFTTYKHTFEVNGNNVKYISSEPINN